MFRSFRHSLAVLVSVGVLVAMPSAAGAARRPARPASSPTTACGGVQIAKPDGSYWTCTFSDEFGATALDTTKWTVQTTALSGFHVGAECFVNSGQNINEANGVLSLTVAKAAAPFTCSTPSGSYLSQYTSGTVNTFGKFSQAYGRFEIRAKFPAAKTPGLSSSLWLWPTTYRYGSWPTNGEIDIAEEYSQYPDRMIPYIHYTPAVLDTHVTNNYCLIDPAQFHSYVAEWTSTTITISFDGKTCVSDTWNPAAPLAKPAPFDQPFMLALTQALGLGTNAVTNLTALPATTQIDYVRVWK